MKLGDHQQAFARDLVKLLTRAFELGYEVRIGEVYRTPEQQKIYVTSVPPRSKTMNSMHLKKCAADLFFFKGDDIEYPKELTDYWVSLDPLNQWGGNWGFRDEPHFQRTVK